MAHRLRQVVFRVNLDTLAVRPGQGPLSFASLRDQDILGVSLVEIACIDDGARKTRNHLTRPTS